MKVLGIIPARLGSQRLKAKPLVDLGGKKVVQRVWEQANKSQTLTDLYVATDSNETKEICEKVGAKVILTSSKPRTGSDRVAEAYSLLGNKADLVLNIQGDMPFINPELIDTCVRFCQERNEFDMATPVYPIYDQNVFNRNTTVKVIFRGDGEAIYFSRAPIPYPRFMPDANQPLGFKHLGLYVFKPDVLLKFSELETGVYESREGLEQLRLLENSFKVRLVFVSEELCLPGIEIDTDEDVEKALRYIEETEGQP